MKVKHFISFSAVIIMALFIMNGMVKAEIPNRVNWINMGIKGPFFELAWSADLLQGQPLGYKLYCAAFPSQDTSFQLVAEFNYSTYGGDSSRFIAGDNFITTDNGITWERQGYFYHYGYDDRGDTLQTSFDHPMLRNAERFVFYMTAYNADGESPRCDRVTILNRRDTVPNFPVFRWITEPTSIAYVGYYYSSTVKAEYGDSSNRTVKYSFENAPQDMTINENTGDITWAPSLPGNYVIYIKAYLADDPNIYDIRQVVIRVFTCHNMAKVSGKVVDENGNPVTYGLIYVFQKGTQGKDSLNVISFGQFFDGNYSFDLDSGTYFIFYQSLDSSRNGIFASVYYIDAQDAQDATPIYIDCNTDSLKLTDVVLKAPVPPKTYYVIGKVLKDADGTPLPNVMVEFFGKCDNGDSRGLKAYTNANGYFSVQLTDNCTYIARASSWDSLQGSYNNYIPIYYNQTTDPTLATPIVPQDNMDTLIFRLPMRPVYDNKISGVVTDSASMNIHDAYVIAYMVESNQGIDQDLFPTRCALTNASGQFEFTNLLPGKYIILVVPPMRNFAPGYYKENSLAVRTWDEATQLDVPETGNVSPINVMLGNSWSLFGKSGIRGIIGHRKGTTKLDGNNPQGLDPVNGATVYITTEAGQTVGYAFSGNAGDYSINDLAKGKYRLVADRILMTPYVTNFEITEDKIIDVNFDMAAETLSAPDNQNATVNSISISPNPASDNITINFGSLTGASDITIFNSLGTVVYSSSRQAGAERLTIDARKFTSGVYWVRISNGGDNHTEAVVLAH